MTFKIGIIGGTGLEDPKILENVRLLTIDTPYGPPSDIKEGTIGGIPCVLLSRHGKKHDISPTDINYRANIWALKKAGASIIITSSASGSLKEELQPGHIVFIDSFIDRTTRRVQSFYDGQPGRPKGICHIPAHPVFNEQIRLILGKCTTELGLPFQMGGVSVCIEGPRYSSRAESDLYRSWGASLVNMTVCPEVVLAKELGIPYATVALVTDYDCWKDTHETVSVDLVNRTLRENAEKTKRLFVKAVEQLYAARDVVQREVDAAREVAKAAVMTGGLEDVNFDHIFN